MMDLSMPNETTANALSPLTWRGVLITLITVPLSLITIFGNILVLISFQMNPLLRTVNNYFLLSLAVADLILGTISMNLYTTYILIGHWTLGDLSCDIWLVVDYVASNASVMNLLAISFDRYLSVTRPLTYRVRRTPRRAAVMITLAWGISVVLWAPAILLWQYVVGERTVLEGQCYVQFLSEPVITFGTAIAAFYLPVSVMAVLYWRVYRETERRSRQLADLRGSKGEETRVSSQQSSSQQHSLSSSRNMSGFGETQTQTNTPHLSGGRRRRFCPTITHCTAVWWKRRHRDTKSSTQPAVNPEEASSICGVNKKNDENALNKVVHIPLVPVNKGSKTENGNKVENSSSIEMCLSESQLYFNQKENPFCSSSVSPTHPPANAVTNARKNRRTWTSSLIREKKAARTLSAILLAFIVTWTPYNIMVLVSTFCDDCIPERLWQLGYWLCYVNSTVNPICYALCNRHFRVTFKALLLCSWRGRSHRKWAQPRGRQVN